MIISTVADSTDNIPGGSYNFEIPSHHIHFDNSDVTEIIAAEGICVYKKYHDDSINDTISIY